MVSIKSLLMFNLSTSYSESKNASGHFTQYAELKFVFITLGNTPLNESYYIFLAHGLLLAPCFVFNLDSYSLED